MNKKNTTYRIDKTRNKDTAQYIKDARKKLGLTQRAFAERVGTTRDNVAKYETMFAMPPGYIILKTETLLKNS